MSPAHPRDHRRRRGLPPSCGGSGRAASPWRSPVACPWSPPSPEVWRRSSCCPLWPLPSDFRCCRSWPPHPRPGRRRGLCGRFNMDVGVNTINIHKGIGFRQTLNKLEINIIFKVCKLNFKSLINLFLIFFLRI